jgi:hypothetical protein
MQGVFIVRIIYAASERIVEAYCPQRIFVRDRNLRRRKASVQDGSDQFGWLTGILPASLVAMPIEMISLFRAQLSGRRSLPLPVIMSRYLVFEHFFESLTPGLVFFLISVERICRDLS